MTNSRPQTPDKVKRKLPDETPTPRGRILDHGWKRNRRSIPAFRTLDRYIGRTFLTSYLICGVSFTFIYICVEALTKIERFIKLEKPLWITLPQYHAAMVPALYANYLGPILSTAAAVATAVALHRANEINSLKACGISVHRALAPVFVLCALCSGLNYFLQEHAIPMMRVPIRQALALTRSGVLHPDPFFDQEGNQLIKVGEYSPAGLFGRHIEVSRSFPDGGTRELISAAEIVWETDPAAAGRQDLGRWILHNGSIQRWNEASELVMNPNATGPAHLKEFFEHQTLEGGLLPIDLESSDQDINYLSWRELKTQLQRQPDQRHLEVKLHYHLAFPLAHLLLPAIAIPLVLASGTRSLLMAVAGSVVLAAAFYVISSLTLSTATHSEQLSPLLAAWLPLLTFGALGVTLMSYLRS